MNLPTLFVSGEDDELVPPYMLRALYQEIGWGQCVAGCAAPFADSSHLLAGSRRPADEPAAFKMLTTIAGDHNTTHRQKDYYPKLAGFLSQFLVVSQ